MLTIDALRTELARITYKPGWQFVLYPHRWEGTWLCIIAELPDADQPSQTTVINVRTAVPPIPHATYFHDWLAYRIARIEIHEMREFLRIDGHKLDDPHAPDANNEHEELLMGTAVFKDPDAVLDYEHNWAPYLSEGDTITDSAWVAEDGITIDDDSNSTTAAVVWLSGGDAGGGTGGRYKVTNHITTAGGREDDWTLHVYVRNQ